MRGPLDRRLGNRASNLLRLGTWLRLRRDDTLTRELIQEIAWMIECSGEAATEELVNVQRELCRWRRLWPLEPARSLLAFRAQQMSDRLLELSGLTTKAEPVSGGGSKQGDTGRHLP